MGAAPFLLVYGLVVSIYNAVVIGLCAGLTLRVSLSVELFCDGVECLLQLVNCCLDGLYIGTLVQLLQLFNGSQNRFLFALSDLVAQLTQCLFSLIDQMLGVVVGVNLFLLCLILSSVLLSLTDSLVDVLLAQVGGSGDGDVGFLAGAQILCRDLDDAVGVDVEGDLDLRDAARRTARGRG